MAIHPSNYAPVSVRSLVAHQPGQKDGEKIKSGRDYSVEFDDALLSQEGWTNPRLDGCEIIGLHPNKFSPEFTSRVFGQTHQRFPNIQHLINVSRSWEGDSGNYDKNPVVQTYTNTIFFGTTLSGYEEDQRFPNVGEDFSYVFINKAFTFDPDNDEFFITELLGEDDKVFERVVKQDLQYSAKFTVRLLDEGTEHDLKDAYTVHFNAGMFSLLATYSSCSEAPFTQESQLTTQYEAKNLNNQFYYGAQYNPFTTNNPSQNNCPFIFNSNNRVQLTGSFKVETNIDTWWWRRPKSSSFFYGGTGATLGSTMTASGITNLDILSTQGNLRSSVFGFFYRLMSKAHPFADPLENRSYATPPAKKDLHILTFNEAKGCVKQIQTELRYGKNTTQALRHFGSISLSPGRKIPIPGCQLAQPTLSAGGFSINSKIVSPAFEEFVVQTAYGGTSNLTSFHSYYTWFAGGATSGSETAIHSYPASINGSNFGIITGSGNFEFAPKFESFTVSKLVKRTNVIMADINKINDLFDGIGGAGFICIPENLNPQIRNNLDYYLKKAELIEKGPNRKGIGSKFPRLLRDPRRLIANHLNPTLGLKD